MLATLQQAGTAWSAWDTDIAAYFHGFGFGGEMVVRLFLAMLLGGVIGFERELRGHPAGLRTFILVTAGAAMAMLVSRSFAFQTWPTLEGVNRISVDPARVAYGVMTGVGFLGAGNILQNRNQVRGLTTAAGIWAAASIGLASGNGLYLLAVTATALMLLVFSGLHFTEKIIGIGQRGEVIFAVPWDDAIDVRIRNALLDAGAKITSSKISRKRGSMTAELEFRLRFKRFHPMREAFKQLDKDPGIDLVSWRRN